MSKNYAQRAVLVDHDFYLVKDVLNAALTKKAVMLSPRQGDKLPADRAAAIVDDFLANRKWMAHDYFTHRGYTIGILAADWKDVPTISALLDQMQTAVVKFEDGKRPYAALIDESALAVINDMRLAEATLAMLNLPLEIDNAVAVKLTEKASQTKYNNESASLTATLGAGTDNIIPFQFKTDGGLKKDSGNKLETSVNYEREIRAYPVAREIFAIDGLAMLYSLSHNIPEVAPLLEQFRDFGKRDMERSDFRLAVKHTRKMSELAASRNIVADMIYVMDDAIRIRCNGRETLPYSEIIDILDEVKQQVKDGDYLVMTGTAYGFTRLARELPKHDNYMSGELQFMAGLLRSMALIDMMEVRYQNMITNLVAEPGRMTEMTDGFCGDITVKGAIYDKKNDAVFLCGLDSKLVKISSAAFAPNSDCMTSWTPEQIAVEVSEQTANHKKIEYLFQAGKRVVPEAEMPAP